MVVAMIIGAYVLIVLLVVRRLVFLNHTGHEMFYGLDDLDIVYFILCASVFWPASLVYMVLKWFVTGSVRKHDRKKDALLAQIQELEGLVRLAKDDTEKRIILTSLDGLREIKRRTFG